MKKLLICGVLAAAVVGTGFAQMPDGLSITGEFKTGFRGDFFGGSYGSSTTKYKLTDAEKALIGTKLGLIGDTLEGTNRNHIEKAGDRSTASIWNDDAGTRFRLGINYDKGTYGFHTNVNFHQRNNANMGTAYVFTNAEEDDDFTNLDNWEETSVVAGNKPLVELDNAWGWFDLAGGLVQVSMGWVDNGRWASPSPEDISFSNPKGGIRFEVKPMQGLSFGWAIRNDGNSNVSLDDAVKGNVNAGDYTMTMKDFFGASGLGASYQMDMIRVAAGLEFRPEGSNRRDKGFGFGGREDPLNNMSALQSRAGGSQMGFGGGKVRTGDVGITAYFGAEVKPIDPLTVQLGVIMANLDDMGKSKIKVNDVETEVYGTGYMWLNQKVAYAISGDFSARLTAHEVFDMSGEDKFLNTNDVIKNLTATTPKEGGKMPVYLEFVPGVDYTINDNLSAYFEVPVKLYGELFELAPKPGVNFKFGPGFEIGGYYQLILAGNRAEVYKDAKAPIRNVVQVNLTYSF